MAASNLALLGVGGAAASAPFDPTSIAGLVSWWDFSALGLTDGTAISSVTDGSGNAHTLSQATGTKQPLFKTAIQNGLGVARFDGSNDSMDSTGTVLTQPDTILVVARVADVTTTRTLTEGITAGQRQIIRDGSGTQWEMYAGTSLLGGTEDTSWHVFTGEFNGASSSLRIDRTAILSGNAGTAGTSGGVRLGINQDGTTAPLNGDIGEVLIYSSLSSTNRDSVEAYLKAKWGTP